MINMAVISLKDIVRYIIKITVVIAIIIAITKFVSSKKVTDKSLEIIQNNSFSSCLDVTVPGISSLSEKEEKTKNIINPLQMAFTVELEMLSSIDLSSFETPKLTGINNMFYNCSSLETLDLSNFDNSKFGGISYFVQGCTSLRSLNLSNWEFNDNSYNRIVYTSGIENNLEELILENVDTSQMTDMNMMFYGLNKLKNLDISSFDTRNVTDMYQMFAGTSSLQSITFGTNFVHNGEALTSRMFNGCTAPERPIDDSWTDISFD